MNKLAEQIKNGKRENVLDEVRQSLNTMRPEKKSGIEGNIQRLEKRIAALKEADKKKEELNETIKKAREAQANTTAEPVIKEQTFADQAKDMAIAGTEKVKNFAIGAVDAVLPKSMTDHMSDGRKLAVAAVATVGIGLLAYFFLRRGEKAEEASEAAAAKAKEKGWGWGKTLLAVAAAGVLGFFGYKMYKQLNDIKQMQKKAEEQVAKLKQEADELRARATTLAGKAKEKLLKKADQKDEQAASIDIPGASETDKEKIVKKGKDIADKAKPELTEAAETVSLTLLGKGLTLLHPNLATKAGFNTRERSADIAMIKGTLNLDPVRKMHMNDLYAIAESTDTDAAKAAIIAKYPSLSTLSDGELRSIYFLALVAKEQKNNIRPPKNSDINGMTVEHLLDQTGNVAWLLAKTEEAMKDIDLSNPADITKRLTELYAGGATLQEELQSSVSMRKQMEELGLSKEDIPGFVLYCTTHSESQLSSAHLLAQEKTEPHIEKYRAALIKLQTEMLSNGALKPEMQRYLSLYTHGRAEFAEALQQKMTQPTVGDALQLYLYFSKAKNEKGELSQDLTNENSLIALMMQMKVLNMTASMNKGIGEQLKTFLAIQAGEQGVGWMLGSSDISLPEPLRKTLPLIGDIVMRAVKQKGKDTLNTATSVAKEFDKKYPWLKVVGGGTLATLLLEKVVNTVQTIRGGILARTVDKVSMGPGYAHYKNPSLWLKIKKRIPFYRLFKNHAANKQLEKTVAGFETNVHGIPNKNPARPPVQNETVKTLSPEQATARKVADGLDDLDDAKKALVAEELAKEAKTAADIQETGEILKNSKQGNALLKGAAETGDAAEVAKVVRAADKASKWIKAGKVALVTAGVAADVAGLVMAHFIIQENNKKIADTKNVALKQIYEESKNAVKLNAAVSGSLLATSAGVALYQAAAGTTLYIGSTTAMAALGSASLAGGVILGGGMYAHGEIMAWSERATLEQKELMDKYSPGQILDHIRRNAPLSLATPIIRFKVSESEQLSVEQSARRENFRAYFGQYAMKHLPEVKGENRDNAIGEYALNAEEFVKHATNGTYVITDYEMLTRAKSYADARYNMRANGEKIDVRDPQYWNKMNGRTIAQMHETNQERIQSLSIMSQDPATFEAAAPMLFLDHVHDNMSYCEQRILSTDFGFFPGSSAEIARGIYAEHIWNILSEAVNTVRQLPKGTKLSAQNIESYINRMRDALNSPPEEQLKARNKAQDGYFGKLGATSMRLSVDGILDHINTYRLAMPSALGMSQDTGLSLEGAQWYYKEKNKAVPGPLILAGIGGHGWLKIDKPVYVSSATGSRSYLIPLNAGQHFNLRAGKTYKFYDQSSIPGGENTPFDQRPRFPDLEIMVEDKPLPAQSESSQYEKFKQAA